MTASYDGTPVRHVWCVGPFRWHWDVTTCIGGKVLASGRRGSRANATIDAECARITQTRLLQLQRQLQRQLDRAAERLTREGLPVRVRLDEQNRACVQFLCACSTRDEVRGLSAILAITPNVRREADHG